MRHFLFTSLQTVSNCSDAKQMTSSPVLHGVGRIWPITNTAELCFHTLDELLISLSSSCVLLDLVMKEYFAASFLMGKKKKCSQEVFLSFCILGNFFMSDHYRWWRKGMERKGSYYSVYFYYYYSFYYYYLFSNFIYRIE